VHRALPQSLIGLATACLLLVGCSGAPPAVPEVTVGSPGNPVLIVAYSPNDEVRVGFEDQLEADLADAGIVSVPSHNLVQTFGLIDHPWVMDAAARRDAPLVLMVRRVITDMEGEGNEVPPGVTRHRTLREYFLNVGRSRLPDLPPPGRQVIEVAGYLRNGPSTELVWSGYTWVDFDGDLGAAIRETSEVIARNLAPACQGISCDF
jgi:hypothetical protein